MKKYNQLGRSMIEMLGVLAIIGVLSVMGIAAYNKAITKHRCNQTISQIIQIVQQTRIAFGTQRNYTGLGSTPEEVRNVMFLADLAPKSMLVLDENYEYAQPYIFKNPFKGEVTLRVSDQSIENDKMAFIIRVENLPKVACMEVAISAWSSENGTGYIGLSVNQDFPDEYLTLTCETSDNVHCTGHGSMPPTSAAKACSKQWGNYIEIKFY